MPMQESRSGLANPSLPTAFRTAVPTSLASQAGDFRRGGVSTVQNDPLLASIWSKNRPWV
jgi:hypothetical protein